MSSVFRKRRDSEAKGMHERVILKESSRGTTKVCSSITPQDPDGGLTFAYVRYRDLITEVVTNLSDFRTLEISENLKKKTLG